MSGSNHSSSDSSKSTDSLFRSRELIKNEYKERILNAFPRGDVFVEEIEDTIFYLTPNTDGLTISTFVPLADVLILGAQPDSNLLIKRTKYTVITAMNEKQLIEKMFGLIEKKSAKTIVLVNGTDIVELRQIQASQVACAKAIIWFNATWRGLNFTEASILAEYPHLKKKYDETRDEIVRERQEFKQKEEELKTRLEEELKTRIRLEEEFKKREEESKKREEELLSMLEEANRRTEEANKRAGNHLDDDIREQEEQNEKTLKRNY